MRWVTGRHLRPAPVGSQERSGWLNDAAAAIEAAVSKAINAGNRTGDIYNPLETTAKKVGTTQMGDAIAAAV